MQKVVQGAFAAYDVVYIGSSRVLNVMQDVIYVMLNVSHLIDITHDRHLKSFLASVGDDNEYIVMVRMQKSLIEK